MEAFDAASTLYLKLGSESNSSSRIHNSRLSTPKIDTWINFLAQTFFGMYYLLEAAVILDELQVDGIRIWSPEWERVIIIEAARFWMLALVCGVVSGGLKICRVWGEMGEDVSRNKTKVKTLKSVKEKVDDQEKFGVEGLWDRVLDIVYETNLGRMFKQPEIRRTIFGLGRRTLANAFDILLPGSTIGLIHLSSGTIGLAMFVTTVLTSVDVWDRCGAELAEGT